jgi:hypothetical protein
MRALSKATDCNFYRVDLNIFIFIFLKKIKKNIIHINIDLHEEAINLFLCFFMEIN